MLETLHVYTGTSEIHPVVQQLEYSPLTILNFDTEMLSYHILNTTNSGAIATIFHTPVPCDFSTPAPPYPHIIFHLVSLSLDKVGLSLRKLSRHLLTSRSLSHPPVLFKSRSPLPVCDDAPRTTYYATCARTVLFPNLMTR